MAPKTAFPEFRHRIVKRPHGESGSNSPGSAGSKDLKFIAALRSSVPEDQPQKKQKRNKTSKEKEVVQVDADIFPTSVGKSKLNALAKDFQEFMDQGY